ncbi:hypothetical protein Tsp_09079 [Trichinella spiralis]|uniref:hypothetical protein n=1 Tax=Trichinella spiralis TaxID=6334 RepID=UPI0001EFC95B|nr:hypothetical protein Tsp_09079 [Trichinella spiralis]
MNSAFHTQSTAIPLTPGLLSGEFYTDSTGIQSTVAARIPDSLDKPRKVENFTQSSMRHEYLQALSNLHKNRIAHSDQWYTAHSSARNSYQNCQAFMRIAFKQTAQISDAYHTESIGIRQTPPPAILASFIKP